MFHALGRRSESDAALADLKKKYAGDLAYQSPKCMPFAARPISPLSGSSGL